MFGSNLAVSFGELFKKLKRHAQRTEKNVIATWPLFPPIPFHSIQNGQPIAGDPALQRETTERRTAEWRVGEEIPAKRRSIQGAQSTLSKVFFLLVLTTIAK